MSLLLFPLSGNMPLAIDLSERLGCEIGHVEVRRFPDDETYLRLRSNVAGRATVFVCTLDHPDLKYLPLTFAAATARDLGATSIGLVAPYLAYMRQDARFKDGEAITSRQFARLISADFDWLVTVDPHLHRYRDLSEIYRIPAKALHAAPLFAEWIMANVPNPLVIGPDVESEQWVKAVSRAAGAPYVVLQKQRVGDRDVEIRVPDLTGFRDRRPILLDDIVSSARTMIESSRRLIASGMPAPICLAVHALFPSDAYKALKEVSSQIVTTNTVLHESNAIDVSGILTGEIVEFVESKSGRQQP